MTPGFAGTVVIVGQKGAKERVEDEGQLVSSGNRCD